MNGSINMHRVKRNTQEVSDLYNSLAFGLDSVTIVEEDDGYRLVVRQFGVTLFSNSYGMLTEARAAFLKEYESLRADGTPTIQPHWTDFYNPQDELEYLTLCMINMEWIFG